MPSRRPAAIGRLTRHQKYDANELNVEPQRNLLIIHSPGLQALSDWNAVRDKIHQRAPDIEVRIANAESFGSVVRRWQSRRRSVVFSVTGLGNYRPTGGTVIVSKRVPELEQYQRLTAASVAAPRTIELMPGMVLKPAIWGEYVITKPMRNRLGNELRLVRTEDVSRRYLALTNVGDTKGLLVKQYIHSVDAAGYPFEYRVVTMFGTVLSASCIRMNEKRPPLAEFANSMKAIPSSDARSVKRHRTLAFDEDVLDLARATAAVFPEVACLGIDILRDAESGSLYVIEANTGRIWNFSSELSEGYDPAFRRSLYSQFNVLDLTAELLIEKTRASAS